MDGEVREYDPKEWALGLDGLPVGYALTGARLTTLLPGVVVLRLEHAGAPDREGGPASPRHVQVVLGPHHAQQLAGQLAAAAKDAEQMVGGPAN